MSKAERLALSNLLAIIHRDGGQYQSEHGTAKAVTDAHQVWAELVAERNALRAALDLAEWTSHGAMLADDGAHCGVCQRNQTEGHATGCAVAAALDNKKPPA